MSHIHRINFNLRPPIETRLRTFSSIYGRGLIQYNGSNGICAVDLSENQMQYEFLSN